MRIACRIVATLGATAVLVLVAAFASNYKARSDARKYLRVVMPMRINTPYQEVIRELRLAGVAPTQMGDCQTDCILNLTVGDEWLYKLHLAAPVGFNGRLDFKNGVLVYKSTSMGQDIMVWSATVAETPALEPRVSSNVDSLGQIRHIHVDLSPSDFSAKRATAYAFNVACIGSIRSCTAIDYLPWNELRQLAHK